MHAAICLQCGHISVKATVWRLTNTRHADQAVQALIVGIPEEEMVNARCPSANKQLKLPMRLRGLFSKTYEYAYPLHKQKVSNPMSISCF